jgi:hypothetical protein
VLALSGLNHFPSAESCNNGGLDLFDEERVGRRSDRWVMGKGCGCACCFTTGRSLLDG